MTVDAIHENLNGSIAIPPVCSRLAGQDNAQAFIGCQAEGVRLVNECRLGRFIQEEAVNEFGMPYRHGQLTAPP